MNGAINTALIMGQFYWLLREIRINR